MEMSSSHALEQERVWGDAGGRGDIFTNLTQDHLDLSRDDGSLLRGEGKAAL